MGMKIMMQRNERFDRIIQAMPWFTERRRKFKNTLSKMKNRTSDQGQVIFSSKNNSNVSFMSSAKPQIAPKSMRVILLLLACFMSVIQFGSPFVMACDPSMNW